MTEYTPKFALGTWVAGETTSGEKIDCGYVSHFDSQDGQHYVRGVLRDLTEEGRADANDTDGWAEAEDLREVEPPEWIKPPGPGHAFVYEWLDDHVTNVSLHAEPLDIISAYFSDADADEQKSLQAKLMEAVMDPGERVELVPGGGSVRFCVVNG